MRSRCLLLAMAAPPAHALGLLVPAYFPPSGGVCGGRLGYWDCLISAASSAPALYDGGVVVVNESGGPGSPRDAAYREAIDAARGAAADARARVSSIARVHLQQRRLQVVGYIGTAAGDATRASVESQALRYRDLYNVSGFFLDGCPAASAGSLERYRVYSRALRKMFQEPIMLLCNFSAVPDEEFVAERGMLNTSVIPGGAACRDDEDERPEWLERYDRSRVASLHRGCKTAARMREVVGAALGTSRRPVGYAYVTDDTTGGRWDTLPSFWASEIAVMSRLRSRRGPARVAGAPRAFAVAPPMAEPPYLDVGRKAVELLRGQKNVYGRYDTYISLQAGNTSARTQCGTFVSRLWQLTYNLTQGHFQRWFGTLSPFAEDYHDAIVNGTGFLRVFSVHDALPGDLVALKYWDFARRRVTGHAMLLVNVSRRARNKAPHVPGTAQYDAWVMDSSATYHGSRDTRAPPRQAGGIGMGIMRLYVSTRASYRSVDQGELIRGRLGANTTLGVTGCIVGYTWSDYASSAYSSQVRDAMRTLVIGRPTLLDALEAPVAVREAQDETVARSPLASVPSTGRTETTAREPRAPAPDLLRAALASVLVALCLRPCCRVPRRCAARGLVASQDRLLAAPSGEHISPTTVGGWLSV